MFGAIDLSINCYILCATGYAEESVQRATSFLRANGFRVVFLGLKSGPIFSAEGASLTPTVLLSHFIGEDTKLPLPDTLLVAGGTACGQQLLADPRVHRLIQMMRLAAKPVGFLYPISYALVGLQSQQTWPQPFLLQEQRMPTDFLSRFTQQFHHH